VEEGNAVIIGREEGNLHLGGSNGMKEAWCVKSGIRGTESWLVCQSQ
jgi:hypothetical protein